MIGHQSVAQEYPGRVSYKSVSEDVKQECLRRISSKSSKEEYPRMWQKRVKQECPTRVPYKDVPNKTES